MVYSHLFVAGELDLSVSHGMTITLETDYPAGGTLMYRIRKAEGSRAAGLAIRVPKWSPNSEVLRNGKPAQTSLRAGYAFLSDLRDGDTVTVTLDLRPRRVYPSPKIASDSGTVAIMRGPLLYCAEGVDNDNDVLGLSILRSSIIQVLEETLGGVPKLRVGGLRTQDGGQLYDDRPAQAEACAITLIPYFAWANRGVTQMRCFLPERG
jgi:uncharacterized protein